MDTEGMKIWRVRQPAGLLLALLLLVPTVSVTSAAETRDPTQYFFSQSFGNLQDEAAAAREQGKTGVLIMFEKADCPWCAKMMATVLNQVPVQTYFTEHFTALQVDVDGSEPITDFGGHEMLEKDFALKHNRIRATPTFVFFDTQGKELMKYTGVTRNAQQFQWLGEFVVNGDYKKERFTIYKRKREQQLRDPS
jgi:thioredoxin-related protein